MGGCENWPESGFEAAIVRSTCSSGARAGASTISASTGSTPRKGLPFGAGVPSAIARRRHEPGAPSPGNRTRPGPWTSSTTRSPMGARSASSQHRCLQPRVRGARAGGDVPPGSDVASILGAARSERGLPQRIHVDNGTEFTSKALDHWAYWNQVELDFSRPGKPTDNPFIEAFNATLRRECLSQHWFISLQDAQTTLERWKEDYNNTRPHSSLKNLSPAHFRAGGVFTPDRNRLQAWRS